MDKHNHDLFLKYAKTSKHDDDELQLLKKE